jgi:hypothetical protein
MVFAFASIAGASDGAAMEHAQKSMPTDSRDHNSARSSPPDITPYVRPVIPEDRESTPLPRSEPLHQPLTFPAVRERLNSQDVIHNAFRGYWVVL